MITSPSLTASYDTLDGAIQALVSLEQALRAQHLETITPWTSFVLP